MPTLKPSAPKKAQQKRVRDELSRFEAGSLHSGSRKGPQVTDRGQAIAVALSEAGLSRGDRKRTAQEEAKQ
jgi:hypothetical protein